jgi:ABC-type transport system substrate-binding protein
MKPLRRALVASPLALALPGLAAAKGNGDGARKVLRVAFSSSETGFDPAKIVDLYSRTVTPHIFEALYDYDHLARPVKIKPQLAEALPEVSADFRVWTIPVRRGIHFADDPAFKGKRRELVAEDFVYAMKRFYDPANKSPAIGTLLGFGFVGLKALRDEAIKGNKPFDYDKPVEGMKAIDRYTVRFITEQPRPRMLELLATPDLYGAVAREVVEFYGKEIDAHPVGTGPFRLKSWRRASQIVLERNPQFRDERWHAEPAADDAEGQAILARLKGRKLPLVDEVQVSIILESQPRWLTFLNGHIDALATNSNALPQEFVSVAMPNGKLAPHLAKRGVSGRMNPNADVQLTMFNMEHPIVGGYTPEKVALRRALSLGYDVQREIRTYWKGAAIPAQSALVPHTVGYDPAFKCESSDYDPARAKALLDMYGWIDRDGDGWREQPDGSPLELEMMSQPEQRFRIFDELWQKAMNALGLRVKFTIGQWPENLKAARNGKYMVWQFGLSAAAPDGETAVARYVSSEIGSQNYARFQHAPLDRVYERIQALPDGPERLALFDEVKRIGAAYMPLKHRVHRLEAELLQPWLVGFRKPLFWQNWWHLVDIDDSRRKA